MNVMKKTLIVVGILLIVVLVGYNFFVSRYNQMVMLDEDVNTAWAQVETQYQRRYDLIPNLVNTVKGFAEQEREVLVGVTEARAKASSIQIDPANLTEESMQQFSQAQSQLNGALSRLLVTVERYPDLKSNQNFLELQAQLEGTENRISVERNRFNETAKAYNTYIRRFPTSMLAGMYGFERKPLFQADEEAQTAPKVEF